MEIEEISVEKCRDSEVLLAVEACAICGTDIRIFEHGHKSVKPPQVIGHEIVGTIAEVGPAAKGYKKGERVTVATVVGCGKCIFCRRARYNLCVDWKALGYHWPGGFAEYVKIPSEAVRQGNLISVDRSLDVAAAAMVEPLSCVINGQEYLHIEPGDTVLVIGAGPIGCMHAKLAQVKGASPVYLAEISEARLHVAKKFGFNELIPSGKVNLFEKVMSLTNGFGVDVVVVACSAKKAQEESLTLAAKQGRISFFGGLPKDEPIIAFDSNALHYRELSVFGAFASHPSQYVQALRLISSGQFPAADFVTGTFSLSRIVEGIKTSKSAVGLKAVVLPGEG